MPRALVLGYRAGLDAAITRRGLDATFVVAKRKPQLAGRDHVLVSDLEDAQEVLRAVMVHRPEDVVCVVTDHEEAVFTAAVLRAHLHLPGDPDHARTLRFRDKWLQKSALPEFIARARCVYVSPGDGYDDLVASVGRPFVVKPANGFGARRTMVVRSAADLGDWWATGGPVSSVGAVAESFVAGRELHLDGLWQDGALAWCCLSRYVDAPVRWADGGLAADGLVDRAREPELHARIEKIASETLGALDAPDTVFHLEVYVDEDPDAPVVFGECAIRVGGGMIPEVVQRTYGVDLFEFVLDLALGHRVHVASSARAPERYHGFVFLRRGDDASLTEADFRRHFSFDELEFPADPGARVGAYGRIGHAIVSHSDSDGLHALLTAVAEFNQSGEPPSAGVDGR